MRGRIGLEFPLCSRFFMAILLLLTAAQLVAEPPMKLGSSSNTLDDETVYHPEGARFLSKAALAIALQKVRDGVPTDPDEKRFVLAFEHLSAFIEKKEGANACTWTRASQTPQRAPDDYLEVGLPLSVKSAGLTVLATVLRTTPGWDLSAGDAATTVQLSVAEVLGHASDTVAPSPGQIFHLLDPRADFTIGELRLCTRLDVGDRYPPSYRPGETLLVFLGNGVVLAEDAIVVATMVLPTSPTTAEDALTVDLADLRSRLALAEKVAH